MAARAWILAIAFLVPAVMPARAQQDAAMRAAAEVAGEAMAYGAGARPDLPDAGMVMAVVRGGDSISLGYGTIDKMCDPRKDACRPKGNTLVRLGSVSKVMTGQVLAALSQTTWLDQTWTQPITLNHVAADYLPSRIPAYPPGSTPGAWPREIMLIDLATHTAGMPRDVPVDSLPKCKDGEPPYCQYKKEVYIAWLKDFRLPYRPGTVANYSNAGFGILGMAMQGATGQSFDALLGKYIREPFTMTDTVVAPSKDQMSRMMTGYDEDEKTKKQVPVPADWNGTDVMQPSGGILSTADDMAKWLKYNLAANKGLGPTAAIAQAMYINRQSLDAVIALDSPGRPLDGIGLGWEINFASGSRPMIIQKTGAFSGFMAYVAFAPGRDVGVFLAVNKIDVPVLFNLMDQANNLIAGLATR